MRARTILLLAALAVVGGAGAYLGLRAARQPAPQTVTSGQAPAVSAQAPQAASDSAAQSANWLYGEWTVKSIAGASPVTAMDGAAADAMKGKTIHMEEGKLRFADQDCPATFERSEESADQFQVDYKVDAATLHLPAPAVRFDGGCADIFVLGPERILLAWNGYFFKAERASGVK
jgi:hypothetical protein